MWLRIFASIFLRFWFPNIPLLESPPFLEFWRANMEDDALMNILSRDLGYYMFLILQVVLQAADVLMRISWLFVTGFKAWIMAKNEKSVFLTYLLWLLGGFFGLHHFYLGRDMQGFLWWCTLGGYMGCGWLRDIFHIREYVADANRDQEYMKKLSQTLRQNPKVRI